MSVTFDKDAVCHLLAMKEHRELSTSVRLKIYKKQEFITIFPNIINSSP